MAKAGTKRTIARAAKTASARGKTAVAGKKPAPRTKAKVAALASARQLLATMSPYEAMQYLVGLNQGLTMQQCANIYNNSLGRLGPRVK